MSSFCYPLCSCLNRFFNSGDVIFKEEIIIFSFLEWHARLAATFARVLVCGPGLVH